MCFERREMPNLEVIDFPADESVWVTMQTSDDKMAELSSWMKLLMANDSTAAWVVA